MRNRKAEIAWLVLGLALLAGLIAAVYRDNWSVALAALRQSLDHPWHLAGAVALFLGVLWGSLLKWHLMSRRVGAGLDLRQSLRLFGTLYLVGTFTPARAGELVVPALMRGGGRLTGVALINRVLESSWTVFVGAAALVLVFADNPRSARLWALVPVLAFFVAAMIVLSRRRFTEGLLALARACLMPISSARPVARLLALQQKHAAGLDHFYDANERLLRLAPVAVVSLLMAAIWITMACGNCLLVDAAVPTAGGDKPVTFMVVVVVMSVNAATMFLSPIPSGIGLSEFLSVGLFAQLGYEQQRFLPFLLLARLEFYLVVVLFYLIARLAGRPVPPPVSADEPPPSPPGDPPRP